MEDEDNIDNNINEKWESIKTITKETKQQLAEKDESTETLKIVGMMRSENCNKRNEESKGKMVNKRKKGE